MGLFINSPKEELEIMGISQERLERLTNDELTMLCWFRTLLAEWPEHNPLIVELKRRLKLEVL